MRRNLDRFRSDFVFQLTVQEVASLRSQFATSRSGLQQRAWGGRRYAPYAFTEHGAIMAAMVLNSARAIEISVYVVRAFVQSLPLHAMFSTARASRCRAITRGRGILAAPGTRPFPTRSIGRRRRAFL